MRLHGSDGLFSLAHTVAPVFWGGGRWPNVDWISNTFVWVGWENDEVVHRQVTQRADGAVLIEGSAPSSGDEPWLVAVLGFDLEMPQFVDPLIAGLAAGMPGLRPFANGDLFDGLIGSIVGQSITVAAAATTERRLASLVHPGIELFDRVFIPSPRHTSLAELSVKEIRSTGVTWRRAEAISTIAQLAADGGYPLQARRSDDEGVLRAFLRSLPLVGPWTAESALLWGLGLPDIYPSGDVALLRAARQTHSRPDMSMKDLDRLAPVWAPGRSWAARLLWTSLLGTAPVTD